MDEPFIAGKKAVVLDLKAGTYYWCACGLSKTQPFCDGAHKGTAFRPLEWKLEKDEQVPLCNCKRTRKPPICDGIHKTL